MASNNNYNIGAASPLILRSSQLTTWDGPERHMVCVVTGRCSTHREFMRRVSMAQAFFLAQSPPEILSTPYTCIWGMKSSIDVLIREFSEELLARQGSTPTTDDDLRNLLVQDPNDLYIMIMGKEASVRYFIRNHPDALM
ncbi:hypothetical protein G7046_g1006 [Stylonectria norvegica]|nr:hypothetical protein G7046_g1006 [Stylonectria norvegica]